jgi:HPt (histidine-containing phosphotransfer) domain-containing protein
MDRIEANVLAERSYISLSLMQPPSCYGVLPQQSGLLMLASPRNQQPDPLIFDLAHLRRYTLGNPELENELLALFEAQLPTLLEQIEGACPEETWKLAVHTLKGSARAVGALAIGDLAVRLEETGHSAPLPIKAPVLDLLTRAIADFRREASKLAF